MKLSLFLFALGPVMAQISTVPPFDVPTLPVTLPAATPAFPRTISTIWDRPTEGKRLYRASVAAVIAANVLDVASSWQRPEANPFLGQPGAKFGTQTLLIKSGFAASSLLIEAVAVRRNPSLYRKVAWLNFVVAGGLTMAATYNFRLH